MLGGEGEESQREVGGVVSLVDQAEVGGVELRHGAVGSRFARVDAEARVQLVGDRPTAASQSFVCENGDSEVAEEGSHQLAAELVLCQTVMLQRPGPGQRCPQSGPMPKGELISIVCLPATRIIAPSQCPPNSGIIAFELFDQVSPPVLLQAMRRL